MHWALRAKPLRVLAADRTQLAVSTPELPHAGSAYRGLRYPGLDRLAWHLLVAGIVLRLALSAHALLYLGYPYEAPLSGSFPFKIHPGTYLLTLALFCALASRGNPLRAALHQARVEPLLAINLVVMVVCLIWVVLRHGTSGAAFMVDTHWAPAMGALALLHFEDARRRQLLRVLVWFMALNAALALAEFGLQARLIPLFNQSQATGFATEEYFRSSALLGHPLVNAKLTAALLPMALLLPMRAIWRWGHVVLLLLALLAFGGRSALLSSLLIYGLWALIRLAADGLRGRFSYLQLTGGSVLLTLGLAALVAVVALTGLGERIFSGLYLDNSASVRLRVWSAYDFVNLEQLWLGISAREIDTVALRLGLDPAYEAIENGWIYLSLQMGLVFFSLWVVGFGCLLVWMLRQAPALAAVGVVVFLLNVSANNALASKTVVLGMLTIYAAVAGAQARSARRADVTPAQALGRGGRYVHRSAAAGPALGQQLHEPSRGLGLSQGRPGTTRWTRPAGTP